MEIFCEEISANGGKIVISDKCGNSFYLCQARQNMKPVSSGGKLITNEKRGLHLTDAGKSEIRQKRG